MLNGMTIGEKIKTLRLKAEWTQLELARRAGLTQGHIANIESGKLKNPGLGTLLKLSKALHEQLLP